MLERKTFHVISEEILRSDVSPPTTTDIPPAIYISHDFYQIDENLTLAWLPWFIANFFPLVTNISFFFIDNWKLLGCLLLLFLIVKFVSRQVERLPSLKSKSYSFRGQTKSLFGSIYRTNSHLEACSTHSRNNTFRCFNLCSREFSPRSTVYLKTSLVLSFDPCTKYLLLRSPFLGSINSREACPRVI